MRSIVRDGPSGFPDVRAGSLLVPNYREFVSRGVKFHEASGRCHA